MEISKGSKFLSVISRLVHSAFLVTLTGVSFLGFGAGAVFASAAKEMQEARRKIASDLIIRGSIFSDNHCAKFVQNIKESNNLSLSKDWSVAVSIET